MKLEELKELKDSTNLVLSTSEEIELKGERNETFEKLRDLGFYRIYNTYYKDAYDCYQFYAIGFINSETGYEFLLSLNEDDDECEDIFKMKFDLYLVLDGDNKWERKEKHIYTGTLSEVLNFSRLADKIGYENGKVHKPTYL